MKTIKFCFSFLLIISSFTLYSQTVNDELTIDQIFMEGFLNSNKEFSANESPKSNRGNSIYIQQVGSQHTAVSNVTSNNSSINFSQQGKGNSINLHANVNSITENIVQKGNYNNIFDNIYAPTSNISLNLTQVGNNNEFQRFGSNSIGDKLKLSMTGENQTIIVRNF